MIGHRSGAQDLATASLAEALGHRLPAGVLLRPEQGDERYACDAGRKAGVVPQLVLKPRSTAEVSTALAVCNDLRQPVVVQGGRTGLVGGARPRAGEVVLSTERLQLLSAPDPVAGTILAEAGVQLQRVQAAVAETGLLVGVDLGSRGSATVGGMVSTNAGGIRVLRYGMMRAQLRGLEAVLADGTIIDATRGLAKDNAGYDLKQLFIGMEGTLGVVTRVRLALHPAPAGATVALCTVPSISAAYRLLVGLRRALGPQLSACEAIFGPLYDAMAEHFGRAPLRSGAPLYLLVETQHHATDSGQAALEDALAQGMSEGDAGDAIVSHSLREMNDLWTLREDCSRFVAGLRQAVGHDVSLPEAEMAAFLVKAEAAAKKIDPAVRLYVFGHLGDGNLHVVAATDRAEAVSEVIFATTAQHGGSISAEHGIGLDKTSFLPMVRSQAELGLMRRLKLALDPHGILGPGRVLEDAA